MLRGCCSSRLLHRKKPYPCVVFTYYFQTKIKFSIYIYLPYVATPQKFLPPSCHPINIFLDPPLPSAYRTSLWGQFYDLGLPQLVRFRFCNVMGPKMRSADDLNILNDQVFPSMDFSSLMAKAYSKMTMPPFIRLKLWKSGSGSMRHHFHTWIGHRSPDLKPTDNLWDVKTYAVVRLSHYQHKYHKGKSKGGPKSRHTGDRIGGNKRWALFNQKLKATKAKAKYNQKQSSNQNAKHTNRDQRHERKQRAQARQS